MLLVDVAELGPEVGVGVGVGSSAKIAIGNTRNMRKTKKTPIPFLKCFKCAMVSFQVSENCQKT